MSQGGQLDPDGQNNKLANITARPPCQVLRTSGFFYSTVLVQTNNLPFASIQGLFVLQSSSRLGVFVFSSGPQKKVSVAMQVWVAIV